MTLKKILQELILIRKELQAMNTQSSYTEKFDSKKVAEVIAPYCTRQELAE